MPQTEAEKRNKYLQRTYGITTGDYEALLATHDGGCWICGKKPTKRRLHVEHDHKTNRVRGLCCWRCNSLLNKANDDPTVLHNAADYLTSGLAQTIIGKE